MSVATPTTVQRRDEMARQIEDIEAIDRLTKVYQTNERLKQTLVASHGADFAASAMQNFNDCKFYVMHAAMASESIAVENGVLVVTGTRTDELTRRLARFNHCADGTQSLAAITFNMLNRGEL